MIVLHYVLARKVALIFMFPGGNWIFRKLSEKKMGHFQANRYKNELLKFREVLDELRFINGKNERKIVERMIDALQLVKQPIIQQFTIYDKMEKLYSLSSYQANLFKEIGKLKNSIDSSSIIDKLCSLTENSNENCLEIDINLKEITELNYNLDNVIRIIDEYLSEKSFFKQIYGFFFDNTFGSQNHFKIELKQKHNCEEIIVKTNDDTRLDALLFSPLKALSKNSSQNISNILESEVSLNSSKIVNTPRLKKNLIIFCGPNGQSFEYYSVNDRWLKFYLDSGIYVCLWNYRSFGESTGNINIQNINKDVESLYNFLKKHYHWDNIGVHGLSIGGIPACYLASKNLVNFCCADRTFSSMEDIVKEYKYGAILLKMYRFLRIGDSENSYNLRQSKCYKVLTIDPNDELIKPYSSLLNGISKLLIDNLVKKGRIKSIPKDKKEKYFLNHFFNDFDFEVFYSHFLIIVSNLKERKNESKKSKSNEENNSYKILSEENTVSVITVETQKCKSNLIKIFTNFRTINKDILQMNNFDKPYQSKYFMNYFFMNLLLWGCSYNDSNLSKKTLYKKTYVNFSNFIAKLCEYSKNEADPKISKSIEILLPLLRKLEKGLIDVVFKDCDCNELSEFFEKDVDINLILLKCGHNGIPGYLDLESFTSNIYQARFINENIN